jgi:hypothetical protein
VNCLCPAFVDTPLVQGLLNDPNLGAAGKQAIDSLGGMIPMDVVSGAFMDLIENQEHNGAVLTVTNQGGVVPMKFPFDPPPFKK